MLKILHLLCNRHKNKDKTQWLSNNILSHCLQKSPERAMTKGMSKISSMVSAAWYFLNQIK